MNKLKERERKRRKHIIGDDNSGDKNRMKEEEDIKQGLLLGEFKLLQDSQGRNRDHTKSFSFHCPFLTLHNQLVCTT